HADDDRHHTGLHLHGAPRLRRRPGDPELRPGMIVLERVGFTGAAEGDVRHDDDARRRVSERLGIAADWATVRQVHGATVHRVTVPGWAGEGDAVWTEEPGLPVAVFTADCLGVAVVADGAVGV